MKLLFEVGDVAKRTGLSGDFIRQLERSGQLTVTARTPRGTRLFSEAIVTSFLRRRKFERMRQERSELRQPERT